MTEKMLGRMHAGLSDDAFEAAWKAGAALSPDEAVDLAVSVNVTGG